jgi:hypothetical protein
VEALKEVITQEVAAILLIKNYQKSLIDVLKMRAAPM